MQGSFAEGSFAGTHQDLNPATREDLTARTWEIF